MTKMPEIIKISKFVYRGYPLFKDQFKFSEVVSMMDNLEKNIIVVKEGGEIKGVALYFMIDDVGLDRIKTFVIKLNTPEGFKAALDRKGDNLHFIGVIAKDVKTILKGLRKLKDKLNPKTISWFKPDMFNFRMVKGVI